MRPGPCMIWRGSSDLKRLVRVIHIGRPLIARVIAPSALSLPVRRGQRLGKIEIWAGPTLLGSRPLFAARSASRPGLGGRVRWYATRTMHDLAGLFRSEATRARHPHRSPAHSARHRSVGALAAGAPWAAPGEDRDLGRPHLARLAAAVRGPFGFPAGSRRSRPLVCDPDHA